MPQMIDFEWLMESETWSNLTLAMLVYLLYWHQC
jgi:hypothetical protein